MGTKKETVKQAAPAKKKPRKKYQSKPKTKEEVVERFEKAREEYLLEQIEFEEDLKEWGIIRPQPLKGQGARLRAYEEDPKILFDLKQALLVGMPINAACTFAGITTDQYKDWMTKYPNVATCLKKIVESGHFYHLRRIYKGKANWQSSAWWLERKFKKDWYLKKEEETQEKEFRVVFEAPEKDKDE